MHVQLPHTATAVFDMWRHKPCAHALTQLPPLQGLIFALVCATTDSSLAVASEACNALVKAVKCTRGLNAVFSSDCCEELHARMRDEPYM